ncbi:MAG: hypothetical protein Q7R81_06055 [Candidatus Peregrinibacteria bacterium]|nr:hypothetical protein [Candidatus Peregrinibacteria bacterium]
MMDLHPHWHTTGREGDAGIPSIPQRTAGKRVPVLGALPSRRPAAIVGILLVLGIGYVITTDASPFQGQVDDGVTAEDSSREEEFAGDEEFPVDEEFGESPDGTLAPVEVRITLKQGLVPRSITVSPGQEIIWINEQQLPHILESKLLFDETGQYLYTPAIFSGKRESFIISPEQNLGTYEYTSSTSKDIQGEITVALAQSSPGDGEVPDPFGSAALSKIPLPSGEGRKPAAPPKTAAKSTASAPQVAKQQSSAPTMAAAHTALPSELPAAQAISSASAAQAIAQVIPPFLPPPGNGSTSSLPPSQEDLIPHNPYTVAGGRQHPFDGSGEPIDDLFDGPTHAGAPLDRYRPRAHTKTGPEVWVVLAVSLLGIGWFGHRTLKRMRSL